VLFERPVGVCLLFGPVCIVLCFQSPTRSPKTAVTIPLECTSLSTWTDYHKEASANASVRARMPVWHDARLAWAAVYRAEPVMCDGFSHLASLDLMSLSVIIDASSWLQPRQQQQQQEADGKYHRLDCCICIHVCGAPIACSWCWWW